MPTATSPFKFLDAYNKNDKDIFFGRDDEIAQLYDLVWRSNLTLVYGQSGTGKTSLVKCGLANRFAESDWFDIHIRRNEDINQSLLRSLKQFEPAQKPENNRLRDRLMRKRKDVKRTQASQEQIDNDIIRQLRSIYKHYLKPVFLIFDQFEELFILGDRAEQKAFYEHIAEILDTENYCRVILIMREESIAELYDFEKVVPFIFDKRLRVEPMGRTKTEEVISRTTDKFGIVLGDDQAGNAIIDVLAGGQGRVELTYLQVFLDQLYQEATKNEAGTIIFDTPLVQRLGNIEDVLGDFLGKQTARIQQLAEEKHSSIPASAVNKVLSAFVTLEGTKRPLEKEEIQIGQLQTDQVNFIVDQLEQRRILRFENDRFELSHDALAKQVAGTRTADEVALLQIANIVNNREKEYKATKTLLNASELGLIKNYRKRLENEQLLDQEKWAFIRKSTAADRRRRIILAGTVLAVMASLSALALVANSQRLMAVENAQKAEDSLNAMLEAQEEQRRANYEQYLNQGNAQMAQSRYLEAAQSYEVAINFDTSRTEAPDSLAVALSKSGASSLFASLIEEGDEMRNLEVTYIDAMQKYQEALDLNFNNSLAQGRINEMSGKLVTAFNNFKAKGDQFFAAAGNNPNGYRYALDQYRHAARIKPADTYIQGRIRECQDNM